MTDEAPLQINKLQSGFRFKQFHMLEQIGVGGQGVVWSALDRISGDIVAIKFIELYLEDDDPSQARSLDQQATRLQELDHPNILPLLEYGLSGKIRYLVSPFISGGSLVDWLKPEKFLALDALKCVGSIASGLLYLHGQGVIHRDLKPGNILLDLNHNAFLTDFGLAHKISETTRAMHTGRGTPSYASPEQHKMAEMTIESDIYSFGIMLYELFTFQLPWKGERILALEQLEADVGIPDPRVINPSLPPNLVDVLRRLTAYIPAERPSSMTQVMEMLHACFGLLPWSAASRPITDLGEVRKADAAELLKQCFIHWKESSRTTFTRLTRFAIIDRLLKQEQPPESAQDLQRFMLQHALFYGYNEDTWWRTLHQPQERLFCFSNLVGLKHESITARCVSVLLKDSQLDTMRGQASDSTIANILNTAVSSSDPWLKGECIDALLALLPPGSEWRPVALSLEQDRALAALALLGSDLGKKAACLIAHLRSQAAVQVLSEAAPDDGNRLRALQVIQKNARSLPASSGFKVRMGISLDWLGRQILSRPRALLAAYLCAFLGVFLGFGLLMYLSYRYPVYMDTIRISNSLLRGVILAVPFGLGILLSRLLSERFSLLKPVLRLLIASLLGAIVLNVALDVYHALILNTTPRGLLLPAGCLLTALGFSLGAWIRSRLWKMVVSLLASFSALAATWWLHATAVLNTQTPMIPFDYSMSIQQVLGLMLVAVLPLSILGNAVRLDLEETA